VGSDYLTVVFLMDVDVGRLAAEVRRVADLAAGVGRPSGSSEVPVFDLGLDVVGDGPVWSISPVPASEGGGPAGVLDVDCGDEVVVEVCRFPFPLPPGQELGVAMDMSDFADVFEVMGS